jgi:3-epi-6-deoxocathasterone 23-monooxygenase
MIISFIRARLFVFDKDLMCFVATCRYGKVFKSHIFGSPTIVSTDADVNKFILQSDAKVFVPSYPKSLMELMGESSILLINGTLQRRIHGLIGAFFKSQQLKIQITKDMHKYVQESMENWKEDQPIYIQDETKKVTSISFPFMSL